MPEENAGYPSVKLLMQAMEDKAKWTPQDTIFRSPLANWEVSGYRTITWKQYVNAVNKLAYWLDETLGKATNGIETVAYFGPDDARYAIIVPVCIKTGRRVSFVLKIRKLSSQFKGVHPRWSDDEAWIEQSSRED